MSKFCNYNGYSKMQQSFVRLSGSDSYRNETQYKLTNMAHF